MNETVSLPLCCLVKLHGSVLATKATRHDWLGTEARALVKLTISLVDLTVQARMQIC